MTQFLKNSSFFISLLLTLTLSIYAGGSIHAMERGSSIEYKVKAAFILNFAKFITWPQESVENGEEFFHICLLGQNYFGNALSSLERKSVGGKKVKVRTISTLEELYPAKMLFISHSENHRLDTILTTLQGRPIVTLSDITGFAMKGGMIEFLPTGGRISFIFNLGRIQAEEIEMKASLLNLAKRVLD